jgi:hypothetical protein
VLISEGHKAGAGDHPATLVGSNAEYEHRLFIEQVKVRDEARPRPRPPTALHA